MYRCALPKGPVRSASRGTPDPSGAHVQHRRDQQCQLCPLVRQPTLEFRIDAVRNFRDAIHEAFPGSAKAESLESQTDSSRQQPSCRTDRWQGRQPSNLDIFHLCTSTCVCGKNSPRYTRLCGVIHSPEKQVTGRYPVLGEGTDRRVFARPLSRVRATIVAAEECDMDDVKLRELAVTMAADGEITPDVIGKVYETMLCRSLEAGMNT